MLFFNSSFFKDHEAISLRYDPPSGLKAIISIHNTKLGPALGGCRYIEYDSEIEALNDVLRLSEGMTYKITCTTNNFIKYY